MEFMIGGQSVRTEGMTISEFRTATCSVLLDHFNQRWGQGAPITRTEAILVANLLWHEIQIIMSRSSKHMELSNLDPRNPHAVCLSSGPHLSP